MANTKPNQKIQLDKLQATLAELEQLEEKPKEELSLRESIYFLRNKLNLALKKGYNYQDLSELLEQQGIMISAATLKQYLGEINKESSKGKRNTKPGKALQVLPSATPTQSLAVISENNLKKSESKAEENLEEIEEKVTWEPARADAVEEKQKSNTIGKRKPRGAIKSSSDIKNEFNQY